MPTLIDVCPVCLQPITGTQTTYPCGHTMCGTCYVRCEAAFEHSSDPAQYDAFKCPRCRLVVPRTRAGKESIQTSDVLSGGPSGGLNNTCSAGPSPAAGFQQAAQPPDSNQLGLTTTRGQRRRQQLVLRARKPLGSCLGGSTFGDGTEGNRAVCGRLKPTKARAKKSAKRAAKKEAYKAEKRARAEAEQDGGFALEARGLARAGGVAVAAENLALGRTCLPDALWSVLCAVGIKVQLSEVRVALPSICRSDPDAAAAAAFARGKGVELVPELQLRASPAGLFRRAAGSYLVRLKLALRDGRDVHHYVAFHAGTGRTSPGTSRNIGVSKAVVAEEHPQEHRQDGDHGRSADRERAGLLLLGQRV